MPREMSTRTFALTLLLAVAMCSSVTDATNPGAATDACAAPSVLETMKAVCDYMLNRTYTKENDWEWAAFYIGVIATYRTTGDARYLREVQRWCEAHQWKPGSSAADPNDNSCLLIYLELHSVTGRADLSSTKAAIDRFVARPEPGRGKWWFVDALFTGPAELSLLGSLTHDERYYQALHRDYWDAQAALYDNQYHLFYQSADKIPQRSPNGLPVFWGRGNGWAMGGLVGVLKYLPHTDPQRERYVRQLQDVARAASLLQGPDGLWRANLLDPQAFPNPETSGSALICYALAWGINSGVLDRATYEPIVRRAWRGLCTTVNKRGRVGWVQRVDVGPSEASRNLSAPYGAGAFLLAASEIHRLVNTSPGQPAGATQAQSREPALSNAPVDDRHR